jgi:hypothetical protein
LQERQEIVAQARLHNEQLQTILTSPQMLRLNQINWQFQGPGALRDFEVASQLQLSKQQKNQLLEWEREQRKPRRPGDLGGGPPSVTAVYEVLQKSLQTILTPSQFSKWQELIGPPFPQQPINPAD